MITLRHYSLLAVKGTLDEGATWEHKGVSRAWGGNVAKQHCLWHTQPCRQASGTTGTAWLCRTPTPRKATRDGCPTPGAPSGVFTAAAQRLHSKLSVWRLVYHSSSLTLLGGCPPDFLSEFSVICTRTSVSGTFVWGDSWIRTRTNQSLRMQQFCLCQTGLFLFFLRKIGSWWSIAYLSTPKGISSQRLRDVQDLWLFLPSDLPVCMIYDELVPVLAIRSSFSYHSLSC